MTVKENAFGSERAFLSLLFSHKNAQKSARQPPHLQSHGVGARFVCAALAKYTTPTTSPPVWVWQSQIQTSLGDGLHPSAEVVPRRHARPFSLWEKALTNGEVVGLFEPRRLAALPILSHFLGQGRKKCRALRLFIFSPSH